MRYELPITIALVSLGALANARDMATCGGAIFAVEKRSGLQLGEYHFPGMQIGWATAELSISKDQKTVRVAFAECDNGRPKRSAPNEHLPLIRKFLAISDFTASYSTSASKNWLPTIPLTSPDLDSGEFLVGKKKLSFSEDTGQLCLLAEKSKGSQWCHTIDPYANKPRAGSSPSVNLHEMPEGYLVVSDWFGAFMLDKGTGHAKWHIPYSNTDATPQVVDAGDRLIFFPHQTTEWMDSISP